MDEKDSVEIMYNSIAVVLFGNYYFILIEIYIRILCRLIFC